MKREGRDEKLERYKARQRLSALHNDLCRAVAKFSYPERKQILLMCVKVAKHAMKAADQMGWIECAERAREAEAECKRIVALAQPHSPDRAALSECSKRFQEAFSKLPKEYLQHPYLEERL